MYKYLILALALSAVAFATEEEDQPMQQQPVEQQPRQVIQTVPVAGGWPGVYGQHVYGQQVYSPWGGQWAGQWAYPGAQYVVQQPAVQHQLVKPAPITHTTKTEVKYTVQQPAQLVASHAGLVYPQHQVVRPLVSTQHQVVRPVVSTQQHVVSSPVQHVVSSPVLSTARVVAAPALTHAYNTYPWTYPGWNGGLYGYPVVGGAYIPGWKKK